MTAIPHALAATLLCLATAHADCIVRHSTRRTADQRISTTSVADTGQELAYAVTVTNTCAVAVPGVVIDIPITAGQTYVKTTAKGDGTDRLFSIDGTHYARWDALRKPAAGGDVPITPADVTSVRWVMHQPLAPNATVNLRYHVLER